MEDHTVHQTEHMTTIEASAVSQQVQQVHNDERVSTLILYRDLTHLPWWLLFEGTCGYLH